MKLQDYFPYDSIILGLLQVYHGVGNDSFFINQPCIVAKDCIITTGETYFLLDYAFMPIVKTTMVKLVDAFYYNNQVYLFLVDVITDEVQLRSHALNKGQTICDWRLFDVKGFLEYLDEKKRINHRDRVNHNNGDDLLEFYNE